MSVYFMGVDTGSNSTKGVLIDEDLKVVSSAEAQHVMKNPAPGYYEHDAAEDWWGDFCRVSKTLILKSGVDPREILAVGTSALGPDCLPVDQDLNPLRPAILYGIDSRGMEEVPEMLELYKNDPAIEGIRAYHSGRIAPKIRWIRKHEPEIYEKTYKFLTASSFITAKLTGNFVLDRYLGPSCFYPLYDPETDEARDSYREICRADQLAEIRTASDIVGEVTEKASRETGLMAGTKVLTGTDDSGAEAISAGTCGLGRMMLQMGSSLYLTMGTDRLIEDHGLFGDEFLIPDFYILSGATNAAGSLTKWCRDVVYRDVPSDRDLYEVMMEEGREIPAGSEGLITLPYFAGERSPINDPDARGMFFGLTLGHTRAHMYRSILESAAFSVRQQIRIMESFEGVSVKEITAVGGGTKNPLWLQIMADVTGRRIRIPEVSVGASYGDALMAAMALKHRGMKDYEDIAACIRCTKEYLPNPANKAVYDGLFSVYETLYESTKEASHKISELFKGGLS